MVVQGHIDVNDTSLQLATPSIFRPPESGPRAAVPPRPATCNPWPFESHRVATPADVTGIPPEAADGSGPVPSGVGVRPDR